MQSGTVGECAAGDGTAPRAVEPDVDASYIIWAVGRLDLEDAVNVLRDGYEKLEGVKLTDGELDGRSTYELLSIVESGCGRLQVLSPTLCRDLLESFESQGRVAKVHSVELDKLLMGIEGDNLPVFTAICHVIVDSPDVDVVAGWASQFLLPHLGNKSTPRSFRSLQAAKDAMILLATEHLSRVSDESATAPVHSARYSYKRFLATIKTKMHRPRSYQNLKEAPRDSLDVRKRPEYIVGEHEKTIVQLTAEYKSPPPTPPPRFQSNWISQNERAQLIDREAKSIPYIVQMYGRPPPPAPPKVFVHLPGNALLKRTSSAYQVRVTNERLQQARRPRSSDSSARLSFTDVL
mmetsp:Transcript_6508/g.10260  ORF Transcript_6508/g.10260 Transcript_6508/m.10260 type:complete len:349 (+) Transcript_6508:16-1062(+)